jgi:hypothetical protein
LTSRFRRAGDPAALRVRHGRRRQRRGLLLDDIRLDAVGYDEDFETGDGGWEADGFVRLYNQLPQTFRAALVTFGGEPQVTYLTFDENGRAETSVDIDEEAVLVVTGTAPAYVAAGRASLQPDSGRGEIRPLGPELNRVSGTQGARRVRRFAADRSRSGGFGLPRAEPSDLGLELGYPAECQAPNVVRKSH